MHPPQFPPQSTWLNIDHPLTWDDLKGHIVILDFWTYCCINCIHILPDLKWLEHKYAHESVVVIGVHSAKFANEQHPKHIQSAIDRYEIEHPVIVDTDRKLWQEFAIRSWPSFVIVGPDGHIKETVSGEGIREPFDQIIQALLKEGHANGQLASTRVSWTSPARSENHLSFPGKISLDEDEGQLFIADSNHNRILHVHLESPTKGKLVQIIGSGSAGREDGKFQEASFFRPQGVFFDPQRKNLFVCDTENHLLRQVDLKKGNVRTIAGTGFQGGWMEQGGAARETALNSPWDCVVHQDQLYVAMAGSHQLWRMNLTTSEIHPFSGNGYENLVDGSALQAQLAQPSGITTDGIYLYFADSEVSAIRQASLKDGSVETIIGSGLFDFGHADGPADQALFQHCLGVCYWKELLFVADTYNHSIRTLDLKSRQVVTVLYPHDQKNVCMVGSKECDVLPLYEPNDVKVFQDRYLFIADTNNHLIRVFNLATKELRDLEIEMGD